MFENDITPNLENKSYITVLKLYSFCYQQFENSDENVHKNVEVPEGLLPDEYKDCVLDASKDGNYLSIRVRNRDNEEDSLMYIGIIDNGFLNKIPTMNKNLIELLNNKENVIILDKLIEDKHLSDSILERAASLIKELEPAFDVFYSLPDKIANKPIYEDKKAHNVVKPLRVLSRNLTKHLHNHRRNSNRGR